MFSQSMIFNFLFYSVVKKKLCVVLPEVEFFDNVDNLRSLKST